MKKFYRSNIEYIHSTLIEKVYRLFPFVKSAVHFIWTIPTIPNSYRKLKNCRDSEPKIIVGSSWQNSKGWISTQKYFLNLLNENDWKKYFDYNSISAIVAEHVWEHLSEEEAKKAAELCFKYLKYDGYIRIAVPDRNNPDKDYKKFAGINGTGPGSNEHKEFYTHKRISTLFEYAGFEVELLEHFNENGEFVEKRWSNEDGYIKRSKYNDTRNKNGKIVYSSIILDAYKRK